MERALGVWYATVLLVLLVGAAAPVKGDALVGYYLSSGRVLAASCFSAKTISQAWSTVDGSVGVCAETTPDTLTTSRTTTNYYQGRSCRDGTATGEYHAVVAGTTATVGLNFTCDTGSCATMTIFPAATSTSSSVLYIGCHEQLGLPADVDVVYAERPASAMATMSTTKTTSGPSAPTPGTSSTGSMPSATGQASGSDNDDSGGGGSKTGVIVGAVIGSVGGVALLLLAFFLGRRCSGKRTEKNMPPPTSGHDGAKPELDGMSNTSPPMAWQYPSSHVHTEMASNEPPAHQLSAERGPYEFPGSYHYQETAGNTVQGQHSYRPQAPYQ